MFMWAADFAVACHFAFGRCFVYFICKMQMYGLLPLLWHFGVEIWLCYELYEVSLRKAVGLLCYLAKTVAAVIRKERAQHK